MILDLPEPDETMTHEELDRLNRQWGNRPRTPMTEDEYSRLRETWEGKVARLRETRGLNDADARALACEMLPRIMGELLAHPTRISMAKKSRRAALSTVFRDDPEIQRTYIEERNRTI